ncbi:MAG: hypothetical protein ACLQGT_12720, partial [Terracidiphilus sp.]
KGYKVIFKDAYAILSELAARRYQSRKSQPMRESYAEKDFETASRIGSHWSFTQYRLSACH